MSITPLPNIYQIIHSSRTQVSRIVTARQLAITALDPLQEKRKKRNKKEIRKKERKKKTWKIGRKVIASKERPISRDTSAFFPEVISPPENRAVSSGFVRRRRSRGTLHPSIATKHNFCRIHFARYVQPTFKDRAQCRNRVFACYTGRDLFFRKSLVETFGRDEIAER